MSLSSHRGLWLVLALLAVAAPSSRAFDFTLRRQQAVSGAFQQTKTYFLDGDSKIFIDVPPDWKVTDSPASLDCLPARASCHVVVTQGGTQPWTFDETGKAALRKRAQDATPQGAKDIKALPEQSDLIPLTGWSSLEIADTYTFYGQQMHRAVIFFNLPEKRVWQVTVTAPEADFAAVHEQTRMMLYGLFEPEKMLSGTALQRYRDGVTD